MKTLCIFINYSNYIIKKIDNKKLITKSSITAYFKKYEFIRKIFADFFFIGKLYRTIYFLCYKYDRAKIIYYIDKLSNFFKNNKDFIFSNYKYVYSMEDKYIDAILNIIIIFEKQNYNTGIEEEYLGRKIIAFNNQSPYHFEKLYKKFIFKETKLVLFTIKDIIFNSQKANKKVKKKLYIDFLDLFFSFKYDFNKLINIKNFIPYFSNKNKDEFRIYENKLKENLPLIRGNQNEFEVYKFILKYSPIIKNLFIFHREVNRFKVLMKKYLNQLVFKWEEDYNFSELSSIINKNILLFSKIFLDIKDPLEKRKNKINFFFDEFINELNPEFKDKFQKYKQLALDYTKNYQDDDNFYYDLNSEVYISMMLIFIRLKFGKYNPQALFTYITYFKKGDYVFSLFLKSYFQNDNKRDILYHFFLINSELLLSIPDNYRRYLQINIDSFNYPENSWEEKILIISLFSQPKLKQIEFSLIFDYIKLIINNNNLENDYKSEQYFLKLFKYIFLGINQEQNQELFELIINTLNEINFFCFLDIDPLLYNEENIMHKIKILKNVSLYLEKNPEIVKNDLFYVKTNKITKKNLAKFIKILKKEKCSFCNCLKNNRLLLTKFLHYLLKSYYNDKFEESFKKPNLLINENEESKIIKDEIFNFFDFYKIHSGSKNEYIKDFSQIFFKIYEDYKNDKFFDCFINHINEKIYSNIIQILYNYNSINITFFKSILENCLFMFLFFFCYITNLGSYSYETDLIERKKQEELADFYKINYIINTDEVSLFLNSYLKLIINKKSKEHYEKYLPIFYNLRSINFTKEINYPSYFLSEEILKTIDSDNIYFTLVFIYINQIYPSYDPSLLYYIYNKFYKEVPKKFFWNFIQCINDKENQSNIPVHLFLENIGNNTHKVNVKKNIKIINEDWVLKKILMKKFITKYLLNLNYSKNSFFYEYIDKKIEKSIEKNKLREIDYIIFDYTSDKNKELYNKIISKFIHSNIPFYFFLEYDNEIVNDQNMIRTIKLLENSSKNSYGYSNDLENIEKMKRKKEEIDNDNKNKLNGPNCWKYFIEANKDEIKDKINLKKKRSDSFRIINRSYYKLKEKEKFLKKVKKKAFLFALSNKSKNYENIIINLYTFFKVIKQERKNLIDIINNNYIFFRETLEVLLNCIIYSFKIIKNEKQKDFLNDQIYEFFKTLFNNDINNELLERYFKNPIEFFKKQINKLKLGRFVENNFIKRNKGIKTRNIPEKEYQIYKRIIINFSDYNNNNNFQKTLLFLFEKDLNKFSDFFKMGFFDSIYHIQIFILIMQKNLNKLISNPELFSLLTMDKNNSKKYIALNNTIVKYILNNSEKEKYSNLEFINNSFIFKDLDSSLFCLDGIYNQQASIFVINKIQKIFKEINTNIKFFYELIKRQVNNNYVFDFLFSSFNDNDLIEIFKNNQNEIVVSLYKYSEINGYKYIKLSIENLSKFMPLDEINNIIYPTLGKKEDIPDYLNSFFKDNKNENNSFEDDPDYYYYKNMDYQEREKNNWKKYLLFHALLNQMISNYETIALLFEYCPIENGIYYLFNLNSFQMMKFLEYISNSSNRTKLKNIGNNLIKCLELFEKFYRCSNDFFINWSYSEKIIFYHYFIIIILQITPEKLLRFLGINDKNDINNDITSKMKEKIKWSSNNMIYMPETELFIILTFYEIKGIPILPIKKYLPNFYSKIEKLYENFEKLEIPKIDGRKDFDIKFCEHYLYLIKEKTEEYLECIPYSYYKNYYLIIKKETKIQLKRTFENNEYIDLYIFDLIEKKSEEINLFYLDDNEIDIFLSSIRTFQYISKEKLEEKRRKEGQLKRVEEEEKKEEVEEKEKNNENIIKINSYKTVIYSLSNFNATSSYILQNNSDLIEKNKWEDETPLSLYISYLKVIKFLYHYISKRKSNNNYYIDIIEEYNISAKDQTRLNDMKNNINLNQIISEIIKAFENLGMNTNVFFESIVKWANSYIVSNNEIMTEYNKISIEKMNIISYFKFLDLNCNILIKIIEAFNTIKEIINLSHISEISIRKSKDLYLSHNYLRVILDTEFVFNTDKDSSKKNSGESLFKLGNDIIKQYKLYQKEKEKKEEELKKGRNKKYKLYKLKKDKNNIKSLFEGKINTCFYFNEKKEKFCETSSDIELIEFIKTKFISLINFIYDIYFLEISIDNYKYLGKKINELLFIHGNLKEKDIYSILSTYYFRYNFEFKDEIQKEKILNIFNPLLEENQNLIASYMQNSANDCNQPNYYTCLHLIKFKINKIINTHLNPCLTLNLNINSLIMNLRNLPSSKIFFDVSYHNYINLDEIISSIMSTEYHPNNDLNSLFQIRAINYIINGNSSFVLFIYKLFSLYEKAYFEKTGNEKFIKKIKNEEAFYIKIKEGKKYTKEDFNNLKKKLEEKLEEEKAKKEKEIKPLIKELKHTEKVQYKLCKFDTDVKYDVIFFPFKSVYYLSGKEYKHQEFNKIDKGIPIHKKTINKFINIYNLIFTVKNIDNNNIITLEKNDISEILKPYSDKEMFYSLLNQSFSYINEDEENLDIIPINEYLRNKKLIE